MKYVLRSQVKVNMSKAQKLRITLSIIVTDSPIKPVFFELHATSFSLSWPSRYTHDLENDRDLDIPKMYLQSENKVARSSHSKM